MRRGVNLETLASFDFCRVVIASIQRDVNATVRVSNHGFYQSAVHPPNLKGYVRNPLGLIRFVDLDEFQTSRRCVVKVQCLGIICIHNNGLAAARFVDGIAVDRRDFRYDVRVRRKPRKHNLAVFIGEIQTV